MDLALTIEKILAGASYSGSVTDNNKESYDKIVWDTQANGIPKPTWDEILNKTVEADRDELTRAIKDEASRRITSVTKDFTTQRNMIALASSIMYKRISDTASAQELGTLALLAAGQEWIQATLVNGRVLAAAGDVDYKNDSKWPTVPTGLESLVGML